MDERNLLAARFEAERPRLRQAAYRMLGSLGEAEDAVQEAWLRLSRADGGAVENLAGWLTTVTARVCLDMLRSRRSRRETSLDADATDDIPSREAGVDPEEETLLADSIGIALLVVLQTLAPAERIAFVLHDMFDLPFDDIAPIVERSPEATRQLASRARRRVRGGGTAADEGLVAQRGVVDAFLAASRSGDLQGLLAVLAPDVVFRGDALAVRYGGPTELHGAEAVAASFSGRATGARPALVDGAVALLVAPRGKLLLVLQLTLKDGKIAEISAVAEPERLAGLDMALLDR
ncbi:sigma-70 family RNA polymerase sigma factor [Caulobacter mirabilis]|uniref:RNA polymerase subunit sigma-70 n=1 Tax=Caulobacter mirabilis TaxID=69666 RepID=A0A2D2B0Q9_9CAUL|nr:sigma-70 family RNA polymerase sigma factor [Caulobacter mirabilis]ATQ43842.1 RNA polymerase subunit sigma-70 [Caulobacter mirabilis]